MHHPLTTLRTVVGLALLLAPAVAHAHMAPPVVLLSEREAVLALTGGAKKLFVRETRLTATERRRVLERTGWNADDDFYRFYLGRDAEGKVTSAATLIHEFTIHGPVRVAVGFSSDGKVTGARVVELTEESYPSLKPLIDRGFTDRFIGLDSSSTFSPGKEILRLDSNSMPRFFAQVTADLVRRAAALFEVVIRDRKEG